MVPACQLASCLTFLVDIVRCPESPIQCPTLSMDTPSSHGKPAAYNISEAWESWAPPGPMAIAGLFPARLVSVVATHPHIYIA